MDEKESQRQAVMEVIKRNPRLDNLVTYYLRFAGRRPEEPTEMDEE